MEKTIEKTRTFSAVDTDGVVHTIIEFRQIDKFHSQPGGHQRVRGTRFLETSDGRFVNRLVNGSYEIVGGDSNPLTSDDPSIIA